MDWFLYDSDLRHERVNKNFQDQPQSSKHLHAQSQKDKH